MMDGNHTTDLILDLRDRMARIETKLDGHQEQHRTLDKRIDDLEARTDENSAAIAAAKVRFATLAAVASGVMAILGFLGEHLWSLFSR